jgi:hypothetical protein
VDTARPPAEHGYGEAVVMAASRASDPRRSGPVGRRSRRKGSDLVGLPSPVNPVHLSTVRDRHRGAGSRSGAIKAARSVDLSVTDVDDLAGEVERLRAAGLEFRNDIITGPGGSQSLLEDPSGNVVKLFQPAR